MHEGSVTLSAEEIERIVQEVIRRITVLGVHVAERKTTLELEDRLITLATVEDRLEDIEQLIVSTRAVVTPSVRDELRDRKIELIRQAMQNLS